MVEAGIIGGEEPIELIGGELIVVVPQGPRHRVLRDVVRDVLANGLEPGFHVSTEVPLQVRDDSLPEPDVAILRGNVRDHATRHPGGSDAVLVVEIAITSHALDRQKADLYAAAGVPAYWLIDVPSRRVEVYSEVDESARYGSIRLAAANETLTVPALAGRWPVARLLGD